MKTLSFIFVLSIAMIAASCNVTCDPFRNPEIQKKTA
jgi:hypothetical protein